MQYRLLFIGALAAVILISAAPAFSGEGLRVGGTVQYPAAGDVYIQLQTRTENEAEQQAKFRMIVPVGPDEAGPDEKPFVFENVPPGSYAISAFQDENDNSELDSGIFGPKEPWGTHRFARPAMRGPNWDEMVFDVQGDVDDIILKLE